jgi:hypothetical protein
LPRWKESAVGWIPDSTRGLVGAASGMRAFLEGRWWQIASCRGLHVDGN